MKSPISLCLSLLFVSAFTALPAGHNLYWPGDFEQTAFGGIYSNAVKVKLSKEQNHSEGGQQSWELHPGYQHLELLVPKHETFELRFHAYVPADLTLVVKVVSPPAPDAPLNKKGKREPQVREYKLPLKAAEGWQPYTLAIETGEPYPGPILTELLLTLYNPHQVSAFVDDLEVVAADDTAWPPKVAVPEPAKNRLLNGDFEAGAASWRGDGDSLSIVTEAGNPRLQLQLPSHRWAEQVIDGRALAGKRVRVSLDVALLGHAGAIKPWSAFLAELANGSTQDAPLLESKPKPFWYPVSLSAPDGQSRRIEAVYAVPEDAGELTLRFKLQKGLAENAVAVDNVAIEVLD